uniref:Ras-GEF domain-containing protein n=1 Tax=Parascaris equorum TaxID=6256 RepID=A0A914RT27_PAREQ
MSGDKPMECSFKLFAEKTAIRFFELISDIPLELSAELNARLGVCRAVGYWIRACPTHFDTSPSYAWLRNVSVRNPVGRQISLSFEQWSADDISTSLSHIDYKALYRVPSLSNWVQCMILSKGTPMERAEVITKFISVARVSAVFVSLYTCTSSAMYTLTFC